MSDGSVGYLHSLTGTFDFKPETRKSESAHKPSRPVAEIMSEYQKSITPYSLKQMAEMLGVSTDSLELLSVGKRDNHTWAFPMRNSDNEVVGIRLRTDTGKKFAETGSRQGLFIPQTSEPVHTAYLPEGPTNTAAALSIGLYAIGRPSNTSGGAEIANYIRKRRIKRAVVIADTDDDRDRDDGSHFNPGFDGAERLAEMIPVPCCVLALPAKDVRKYVQSGGTAELVYSMTKQAVWRTNKW